MHSLELTKLIFKRELSALLSSRTYFAFFVILCALTGFSFTQALSLYSEASLTGIQYPELARGLSPFDGVFVPTFGGLYLGMTLLFPLLAIQILSAERDSGSLLYLFQWPISRAQLIFAKVMAVLAVWILGALPIVVSILTWVALKGHFASGELFIALPY